MNAARSSPIQRRSLRGLLQVLIVLGALSQTAAAEEVVLDFEEVRKPLYPTQGPGGDLYTVIRRPVVTEQGFKLQRPKAGGPTFAYWDPEAPQYTGSVALQAQRPFNESTTLERAGQGGIFRLVQFEATNCCGRRNSVLTVQGIKTNGRILKRRLQLPKRPKLKVFRFTARWSDLESVSFSQTDFIQLDNIMLDKD